VGTTHAETVQTVMKSRSIAIRNTVLPQKGRGKNWIDIPNMNFDADLSNWAGGSIVKPPRFPALQETRIGRF
jgi:hypothetical protein